MTENGDSPQSVVDRELILGLIGSDAPERRRAGLMALSRIAEEGDVALLAVAARHQDPDVRLSAVEAIGEWADDPAVFEVLTGALHDADARVRMEAVDWLGTSGHRDAVADLVTDADPRVRGRVAHALGRIGGSSVVPVLLLLHQDHDSEVRDRARHALGSAGDPAAVDVLLADATAPDARVRGTAAKALARAFDSDPRVAGQLLLLARDVAPEVRAAVLSGAATTAAPWPSLAAGLVDDPDTSVRHRLALVVRDLAPDAAASILRRLADDPEPIVREAAARTPIEGTIDVDGQVFTLRATGSGTHYTWVNGPNPGYGFSATPTLGLTLDQHRDSIRDFLAMIDSSTGYIGDD